MNTEIKINIDDLICEKLLGYGYSESDIDEAESVGGITTSTSGNMIDIFVYGDHIFTLEKWFSASPKDGYISVLIREVKKIGF